MAKEAPSHDPYFHHLAERVAHNLEYQHQWTVISVHTHSPLNQDFQLPRPILSGLPPQRIYVHPDEQIELLKKESKREADGSAPKKVSSSEREWVLPTHLREKWSLKKFAEIFDRIGLVPDDPDDQPQCQSSDPKPTAPTFVNKWRTTKRVLLATVDDDSTIVYYIVHDGIVKPRQN
ncbi:MAG: hypothetical protein M1821_006922 [Bathelium mastoideum]|nr:MAG: hypothetical protein M1821_006922 [Bathelium mastoideum]KAI9692288.1 MAG: hypothetical protein M1822_006519 [Bathelium mastoideum]